MRGKINGDEVSAYFTLAVWTGVIGYCGWFYGVIWGSLAGVWAGSWVSGAILMTADYFMYRDYYSGKDNHYYEEMRHLYESEQIPYWIR